MSSAEFLTTPALAAVAGLRHGFFTRLGGVSEGPWAALNCSLSGQDDRERVRENRRRAADALGLPASALHGLTQVHSIAVAEVGEQGWREGEGPRADAVVTRRAGVLLGIVTADCAPVLFAEPEAGVIGAAHAGWRGAVDGVIEATIHAMEGLGASRARMLAAVGPCIGQASYEVGPDLREAVLARAPEDARHFAPGRREERWQFDLAGYCAARLTSAGVAVVETAGTDTLSNEQRFFSHRRRTLVGGGPIGHQLSAISIAA